MAEFDEQLKVIYTEFATFGANRVSSQYSVFLDGMCTFRHSSLLCYNSRFVVVVVVVVVVFVLHCLYICFPN
jgi:hypothetical protein